MKDMSRVKQSNHAMVSDQLGAQAPTTIVPELLRAPRPRECSLSARAPCWRWSRSGKMPRPIKIADGTVRFRTVELREWIAAGCPRVK